LRRYNECECDSSIISCQFDGDPAEYYVVGRGLHSSTSQLNLSAFYGIGGGIGGARRGCVARVKGVLGGV